MSAVQVRRPRPCPARDPARRRVRLACLALALVALPAAAARADEAADLPATGGGSVFVSGVADEFPAVRQAVARAKALGGRDYRVVVVGDAGGQPDAARKMLDTIVTRWREQARGGDGGEGFDPSADVAILLDVGDRLLAMIVPWSLEAGSGLDQETLERELIRKAFVPRAKDGLLDEGLADLVDATEAWVRDRREAQRARTEAARVFRTRTLPLGIAGLAGAGLVGGLLLQRGRHDRRLAAARARLAAFKEEVVALSDLLDAQQERHRMLPHSDPDFKTPMEGLTRSAYDGVQAALGRYRERWLGLMDVWERAQKTIEAEWFLGTTAADEAIALLDSAEARPPLDAVAGECRGPLDALEQAHETARRLAEGCDRELATVGERLAGLTRRGRSPASFQPALAEAARGRELAGHDVERDPVAARGRLEQAESALGTITARIDAIEAADDRRQRATRATDELESLVRAKRAEGWLLAEPGADPDEQVTASRRALDLAAQLLDAGETEAALVHVERAEQAQGDARKLVESIVAARTRVEELLPGVVARLEALAGRREQAIRALEHLAAAYAESSWSDVAGNVAKADEGLLRVRALVEEARAAAAGDRQHYFRAVALVEEAIRQQEWIEGCQAAIVERQAELDGLRAGLPQRRDTVRGRVDGLEQRLHRSRTDRVRANERCREAGRILEVADGGLAAARPDLRQVAQLVQAADETAARAEQLADEDERLAGQAAADIEETDALVRRVAAWYAEGVQADVGRAAATLDAARSLLERMQYEDSIRASAEAAGAARAAYAAATAEAQRRRIVRQQEMQRRQLEESFARMSRGAGPWVIQLPGGVFTGPDPWRTAQTGPARSGSRAEPAPSRTAGGGWSRDIAQVGW